jgi:hypothetical protein
MGEFGVGRDSYIKVRDKTTVPGGGDAPSTSVLRLANSGRASLKAMISLDFD